MPPTPLPQIPLPYRILLLWFEPLAAFNGALLAHFAPKLYLNTMSAVAKYDPDSQVILDQIAATYFLFAFNEAIVLRLSTDLRVWKAMVFGILVCDLIHLYGSWTALGTEVFFNPLRWRAEDVVNMVMLYGPGGMRLAFLLEVGYGREDAKAGKEL